MLVKSHFPLNSYSYLVPLQVVQRFLLTPQMKDHLGVDRARQHQNIHLYGYQQATVQDGVVSAHIARARECVDVVALEQKLQYTVL